MKGVIEIIKILRSLEFNPKIATLNLVDALNHVSCEDVYARINFPPFSQSAMDGYALASISKDDNYKVIGLVAAGDDASTILIPIRGAIRIFTGAMLPSNTIAVVKQEDVVRRGDIIEIKKQIIPGENMRVEGEQTKVGELLLKKGTKITPGMIGFLAMQGIFTIKTYQKPSIQIIGTGSELQQQGEELQLGKIFESNTLMLKAAFKKYGFNAEVHLIPDDLNHTKTAVDEGLKNYDLLVFTGGISVGDYDFVKDALQLCGVETIFYKVKQKPGKPLYFGKRENHFVFALPGNPAAAITSFYVYILEFLSNYLKDEVLSANRNQLFLSDNYKKSPNLTYFLKGRKKEENVEILNAQSSAMLSSFADADCLIILPEGKENFEKEELVDVLMI